MVKTQSRLALLRDESGTSLTEGLILFPVMILAISVCVEFGFLLHQWNMGAKAMQMGVRKLVVSEPVTSDFDQVFAFDEELTGELMTANADIKSSCGAGTANSCDSALMQRIVFGGVGANWRGLNAYFSNLAVEDIRVTYELNGLGYHGRPNGAVVSVRMELDRSASDLPITGALLNFLNIRFPPFSVTATSEDLQSCAGGCS